MKKVIPFILLSALIFSTMEVALKTAGSAIDPLQMTFLRFLIGGIILLPIGITELKKKQLKLSIRQLLYLLLLGVICVPFSMILFQYGVMNSNAATSAVLFCVNPIFTAIFAHFMNKNDKMTWMKILSISIAIPGILFMIRPWNLQPGNTLFGAFLTLGAAITFSLYSVMGTRTVKRIGTFAQTSISFLGGSFVLLIMLIIMDRPIVHGLSGNIPIVLYIGIVVTGAGYLLYFLAIRYSNASTGSVTFLLKPAISPIIAVIVLSEKITWNMYIGIVLILVASWVNIMDKRKSDKVTEPTLSDNLDSTNAHDNNIAKAKSDTNSDTN